MGLPRNLVQRFRGCLDTSFSLLSFHEKVKVPRAEHIPCRKGHKDQSGKIKQTADIDLAQSRADTNEQKAALG